MGHDVDTISWQASEAPGLGNRIPPPPNLFINFPLKHFCDLLIVLVR